MTKQKEIVTFASDLETIIAAAQLFARISDKTLPESRAMEAYDTYHKAQEPMLRNYQRVPAIREILKNFDKKLEENYPGKF